MTGIAKARLVFATALAGAGALGAIVLATPGTSGDGVFRITLRDGEVGLESRALAAGRQVVAVENGGTGEHELVVVRTDLAPAGLPVGLHGVSIGRSGELVIGEDHLRAAHRHPPGVVLGLRPGESRRHQVDLAPGDYVVFCQTGSHYLAGERAALTVG